MIIRRIFSLSFSLILLLQISEIQAQSTQAMYYLNYPHSVYSLGMGEQTVALRTSEDAPTYNPANLVFVKKPTVSFFHQPFQMASYLWGMRFPLNSFVSFFNVKNIGSFGIEYIDWDWGEVKSYYFDGFRMVESNQHIYDRTFSIGYARIFSDNFSAGIQLRYAKSSLGYFTTPAATKKVFLSAGLNYSPQILDNKFNIGFSLTNFGTTVWYEDENQADAPPSKLNLGLGFLPIENDFFSLQTQLAISKPFDRGPMQNGKIQEAESSFKTLFTDWDDFPNDAILHTGIAFNWKPIDLCNGFAFFQEFYLGNYSVGIKTGLNNFYTHGGKIGIEFDGLRFTVGYAGRWHNVHYANYLQWIFPYETVQFTFGMNEDILFGAEKQLVKNPKPKNIILSIGVGKSFRVGKLNERQYPGLIGVTEGFNNGNVFFIEGAFYINEQNAIVSNVFYNPTYHSIKYQGNELFDSKVETISFASSYRYHPLEMFLPLYLQGGLAIVRLNPTLSTLYPKYDYKTSLLFSIGGNVEVYEEIFLSPFCNYNLLLSKDGDTAPGLGGFNQFDLGLKVGYKF